MNRHIVLFVDDEENILNALARVFRDEGYIIQTATSGEQALNIIDKNKISLVISDHRMPTMTGVELLQKVKERSPDTIRVLLTGYSNSEDAIAAINQGGVHRYFVKPWNDRELLHEVRHCLEKYDLVENNKRLARVTARQRDALKKANKELYRQRKKIDAIVQSMQEGLIVVDNSNRITFANRAFAEMLGENPTNIIGEKTTDIFEGPDYYSEKNKDRIITETGSLRDGCFLKRREKKIPVVKTTAPLTERNGDMSGYVATIRDITKEKELEQMKADFIAMIIHDLRSPLVSNMCGIKLLQNKLKGKVDEICLDILKTNYESSDRLLDLVNNILEVSKFESGHLNLKKEDVDVCEIINISVSSLNLFAQKQGVTLTTKLHPYLPTVSGDRKSLVRSMINLIGNAIKFTPKGGKVHVEASFQEDVDNKRIAISISDTGKGIPKEELPKIFDMYFHSSRKEENGQKSTGLGLAITKKTIEAHGGNIRVESTPDVGSTFTIEIPI